VHELSLSSAIINTAVRHAGGRRVSVVSLRVGRLRQVVPETLDFYFEFVARGTLCEGARLEQEVVDSGNEFLVESIEVEEAACIAPA
jgi:hydrogenase nickel incorporation protein HypA/HybF